MSFYTSMKAVRLVACGFFALQLTACGYFIKDRSSEYVDSKMGEMIEIPGHLSDIKISSQYPIPDISREHILSEDYELPAPPNATAALDKDSYVVETVGDQTWLRLYAAPGKVWPLLDAFWDKHNVKLARQNIRQGLLQTEIVALDSGLLQALRDQGTVLNGLPKEFSLQARLFQGMRRSTAELQLNIVPSDLQQDELKWLSIEAHPEIETALLNEIGEYVGSEDLQNRHSLLANTIGGEPKILLGKDQDGVSYLRIDLSYLRTWVEIGKALKLAGVKVSDVNRTEGRYYISYLNDEEMDSWFEFESTRKERLLERNMALEIKPATGESGKPFDVRVIIMNESIDSIKGEELLSLLFEHIS